MTFSLVIAVLFASGCRPSIGVVPEQRPASGQGGEDSAAPAGDTGDTGGDSGDTGTEEIDFDCDAYPEGPYDASTLQATASEDLAWDLDGHLVGSDQNHIYKTTYDGDREIFVPNLPFRAGMRNLPTGELVIANNYQGSLIRIDEDGSRETILMNLKYPNGLEVDREGYVYVTEQSNRRVLKVDPFSGEFEVVTDGVISSPNGITFDENWEALYVGGFSGAKKIYRIPLEDDGSFGDPEIWAANVGTGWLDGMGVDYCGYVYIADYGASRILRFTPEGEFQGVVVDGTDLGSWTYMPNFQWGSGIGGWDEMHLFIPDGSDSSLTYELELNIPSKVR